MAANEVHAVCIDAYCVAMFARAITRVFILYIYMSLYVCLWSKNIYTTGNWIRSLFFCCCCKSASIKLCQSWKMPAGEVRKKPKPDQIYLGSWFFTHLLENKLGNGCSAWFLKVEAVSMLYNIIFFSSWGSTMLDRQLLQPAKDGTCSMATVVHALQHRLLATSPSTTWLDPTFATMTQEMTGKCPTLPPNWFQDLI